MRGFKCSCDRGRGPAKWYVPRVETASQRFTEPSNPIGPTLLHVTYLVQKNRYCTSGCPEFPMCSRSGLRDTSVYVTVCNEKFFFPSPDFMVGRLKNFFLPSAQLACSVCLQCTTLDELLKRITRCTSCIMLQF